MQIACNEYIIVSKIHLFSQNMQASLLTKQRISVTQNYFINCWGQNWANFRITDTFFCFCMMESSLLWEKKLITHRGKWFFSCYFGHIFDLFSSDLNYLFKKSNRSEQLEKLNWKIFDLYICATWDLVFKKLLNIYIYIIGSKLTGKLCTQ